MCQNNKGTTGSGVQTEGRRWRMLAHRALQGMGAQQPMASSFLMSSWCPTRLWKEIKKRKKERKKKKNENSCIFV